MEQYRKEAEKEAERQKAEMQEKVNQVIFFFSFNNFRNKGPLVIFYFKSSYKHDGIHANPIKIPKLLVKLIEV